MRYFLVTTILMSSLAFSQQVEKKPTIFDIKHVAKENILADLDQFVNFIKETHPRIGYTANNKRLDSVVKALQNTIKDSMPINKVWDVFATLNPFFNDAHVGIIGPNHLYEEYVLGGGSKLPFSVKINDGSIFIDAINLPENTEYSNYKIVSINGVKSSTILEELLPKMRGESRSLQELILSKRFPVFYIMYYGDFKEHTIELADQHENKKRLTINAIDFKGFAANKNKESYYALEMLNDSTAYLKIASFDIENKDVFKMFLEDSFAKIHTQKISNLILDVGENGGGARDLSDLLLDYLTENKYTATSKVEARVTSENQSLIPNAKIGDVVTVPFPNWVTPNNEVTVFKGNVYALVSKQSYSQAIVFTTIIQDFNLAKIIGEETAGKANQTGQVQNIQLNYTGFTVYCPIYIFSRAKVVDESRGVIPDVEVTYTKALEKTLSLINCKQRP
ncbi:S41 family peptidase [uncultured Croceitalea sp.]|uniref:S41 family peptidase n=1 Tax=uncultured Croceitalea sp. TaxID=1798908 RepID=UPI00330578F3